MRSSIFTIPASSNLVYPVDQYVAPVEISIQVLSAGGTQVTVQATVVPFDQLDGPLAMWFNYAADASAGSGPTTLGSQGTINTYSNKIVTAIRFVNAAATPVTVALAEAGIIS